MKDMRGESSVASSEGGVSHKPGPFAWLRVEVQRAGYFLVFPDICPQRQLCRSRGLSVFDRAGKAAVFINNVSLLWPVGVQIAQTVSRVELKCRREIGSWAQGGN